MKIRVKTKDCYLVVKVKLSFGEKIEEANEFSDLGISELLKAQSVKKTSVEYTGPIAISLLERLNKPITKWDFFLIMEQIVVMARKLEQHNLSKEHLVLDMEHVFINESTKELYFIYFPLKNKKGHTSLLEFVKIITSVVKLEQEADMEYASRFSFFLRNLNSFHALEIERYIINEDYRIVELANGQIDEGPVQSEDNTIQSEDNTIQSEDNTIQSEDNTIQSEDDAISDEYDTIQSEESELPYFSLYRVQTDEDIKIDKSVFRLGRERNNADYYVDNKYVARRHAELIKRGDEYYIVDLESSNHTYLNGIAITPRCETKLLDGDKIRLSNEEFIFREC